MRSDNFDEGVDLVLRKDARYHRDAYFFVREALSHTQKAAEKTGREGTGEVIHHVTGQELLEGIRVFALQQFGPMAPTVFEEWGVRRCEDFGEIVFNLVENSVFAKTKDDSREDFKGGYGFDEAFRKPFLPSPAAADAPTEARPDGAALSQE
jgi:uncharacterized repeat protein (TIGR04138 family)